MLLRLARRLMRQISRRRGQSIGHASGRLHVAQLGPDLETNIEGIVQAFGAALTLWSAVLERGNPVQSRLPWFIEGLVDKELVAQCIIRPVTLMTENLSSPSEVLNRLYDSLLSATDVDRIADTHELRWRWPKDCVCC